MLTLLYTGYKNIKIFFFLFLTNYYLVVYKLQFYLIPIYNNIIADIVIYLIYVYYGVGILIVIFCLLIKVA